ncbi:MAG TPA: AMP-binding protein [Acidimicrobiales bacterium]|nr:AMP-binding protein [Acidimicrobiales bacterium]
MTAPAWTPHLPAGTSFAPGDLTADGSLVAAWIARWRAEPACQVVHDASTGWATGADLERGSRAVAARLAGAGVQRGDRVLLSGPNSLDLVLAHIGCLRLGAVVVPVNGAYREQEIAHVVRDCAPRAAVVRDAMWPAWIRAVEPGCFAITPRELARVASSPLDQIPDIAPMDDVSPGDPAIIGYTSGTTGAPKGAVLTHANVLAGAAAVRLAWRWRPDDRLVLCLPLFHMHGLGVGLHGTLLAGGSVVLLDGFDADEVLDAARAHAATLFFGVPTMYHRLADSDRVAELGRLRLCVAGSAPLAAALHDTLAAAGVRVLERYGMTETVMLVSNPYDGERRAGTVGFPLPGVELRLAGGDDGEIEVRGPNVFAGYWHRPDETAASFTDDGWFRTGDLGAIDHDGYVRVVGRSKELIISGGFNVYPREVEDTLAQHPAIAEVAVVGRPSAEWGEEVTAYVVVRAGHRPPSVDELRTWGRSRLAPYKLPRAVLVLGSLPRNALGKVVKGSLPTGP